MERTRSPHLHGSLSNEGHEEINGQRKEIGLVPEAVEPVLSMEGAGVTLAGKGRLAQAVSECGAPCSEPQGTQPCHPQGCEVFGLAAAQDKKTAVGRQGLGYNKPQMPY